LRGREKRTVRYGWRQVNKEEENRDRKEGWNMKDSCRKGTEKRGISE
jgi:hypothetical protein